MKYGLHISAAGDLSGTPARAKAMGAEVIQIFSGSPRTFKQVPVDSIKAEKFVAACAEEEMPAYIHMMYLTSYGSPDKEMRDKSITAAVQTMENADALGIKGVVTHLGSHKGLGTEAVIGQLRDALLKVADSTKTSKLLLENSAGAGGNVGNSFEELALIYEALDKHPNVGFCLDTAHMFAADYEVNTEAGWKAVLDKFDELIGLNKIGVFHLNDSKVERGTRRDRHENIGAGFIGEDGFKAILNEPRLKEFAGVLEVPGLDGKGPDKANLDKLRELTT